MTELADKRKPESLQNLSMHLLRVHEELKDQGLGNRTSDPIFEAAKLISEVWAYQHLERGSKLEKSKALFEYLYDWDYDSSLGEIYANLAMTFWAINS
ncbi:hypothetical protein N9N48_06185 [Luminiphilus sp.]|nr:hypothetical protein [Luminiphilus sp.]